MTETQIFEIVIHAGEAKAEAFAALKAAQTGDFAAAELHLKQARAEANIAHMTQTTIIQQEAAGEKTDIPPLLIHAMDLLMTAISEMDLIENLLGLYRTVQGLTDRLEAGR